MLKNPGPCGPKTPETAGLKMTDLLYTKNKWHVGSFYVLKHNHIIQDK